MINVNDLKNGVVIEYDGKLVQIMEFMNVNISPELYKYCIGRLSI